MTRDDMSWRERLDRQLAFVYETGKLKRVLRRTYVEGADRPENTAEHSWHVALTAYVLREHADERELDIGRVVLMLLVHDLVEIGAGDAFLYTADGAQKAEAETQAANHLFALLPEDQGAELRGLWEEFESRATREAVFAAAVDRLHPVLMNSRTHGRGITDDGGRPFPFEEMVSRNGTIADGSKTLWRLAADLIRCAADAGFSV
jgi:5'-deoxynucleotidase YfbR-like HD superfamily hydrolase